MASQGARPSLPPSFKKSPKTKEPIRLPINGKIVGAILGVLLLAGVAYGLFMMGSGFFVQAGLPEYERVKPIWTDAQNLRRKDASSEDWALFQKRHEGEIKKLLTEIEDQSPGSGKRLLQLMYFCVKDHLPKIMVNGDKERMKAMDTDMKEAAKLAAPPP